MREKKRQRWSRRIGERERGDEKGEGMRGRRKIRREREKYGTNLLTTDKHFLPNQDARWNLTGNKAKLCPSYTFLEVA